MDCTAGLKLSGLPAGEHTLVAIETDAAGKASAPATYTWTVKGAKVTLTARVAKKGVISPRRQVTVMCKVTGDTLKICSVKFRARVGKKVVVVGTGRRAIKPTKSANSGGLVGKPALGVKVTLNKAGRQLLAKHPKTIKVTLDARAQPLRTSKLISSAKATIRPARSGR